MAVRLRARGTVVDIHSAADLPGVAEYDAIVVGSAVREQKMLPAVEDFLLRNADTLLTKPVWLFSVGMSPSLRGPIGRLLRGALPPRIALLCDVVQPRDYHAFAGVVPRGESTPAARVLFWLCGGRYGDLRDWPAIESWTAAVADELLAAPRTR
jgi:menaquinone-dependent protoporphyrinogen oxidase